MTLQGEGNSARIATSYILPRVFVLFLGLGAVAWGGFMLPLLRQQAPANRVASELLQGRDFKLQTLTAEAQKASGERSAVCSPTELRSAVVLRRAILSDAITSGKESVDSDYFSLVSSAGREISCSPGDPFVWLTLFGLDAAKNGLTPVNERYLRLSYALGPNEGWIAYWRVQLALAQFERLPTDLSNDVLDDFVKLVDTQVLYQELAGIFAKAPPEAQRQIVDHLKNAEANPRQIFARVLSDKGLGVNIPGITMPPARPWE
jgi:hypothetical protein